VSLIGIEVLTIDARIVVASVDTYLRFAEAVNRLDISQDKQGLPQLVSGSKQSAATRVTKGWTAPSFLEAVTSGKVGTHGITEAAPRRAAGTCGGDGL
jgi:hypothetical protein